MFASTVFALALFAAPDAAANTDAAAPAPQAQAPAEAKPKKKCVKQPEVSGSRLQKKVCVTETPKAVPAEAKAEDKPA